MDLLNDHHARRRNGRGPRARPLGRAADDFLDHRQRTKETNTAQADGTALGHIVRHIGQRVKTDGITAEDHLQPWFDARLDEGYKTNTLERYRRSLSAFFAWLGGHNPADEVVLPKVDTVDARPFSDDELGAIREAASGLGVEHRRFVELGVATGGRYRELLGLRFSDFDEERRAVRFARQAVNEGPYRRTKGLKGDKNRSALVLPNWWEWHEGGDGWVVGRARLMGAVLEAAGIDEPEVLNHAMRHTYARICRERLHVPISILQVYLGHSSERTTEDAYGWMGRDVALDYGVRAAYGDSGLA